MASKDHLEDVKREVLVVGELIEILSGEQKYLQRKLERHIKTVVSHHLSAPASNLGGGECYTRILSPQGGNLDLVRFILAHLQHSSPF
jgi:hypothetical protein